MDSLKSMKKRILEIAYKNKLSHLGSYFSCLPVIDEAYSKKNLDDVFVLSCGHAALALYVALEKYEGKNAEDIRIDVKRMVYIAQQVVLVWGSLWPSAEH